MSLTITPSPFLATDEQSIGVLPLTPELTVTQAAEFLNMSERHLNDLLNVGRIAFRLANGERLIHQNSLREYEQWRERRHTAFDAFVRMNQEMGQYDD